MSYWNCNFNWYLYNYPLYLGDGISLFNLIIICSLPIFIIDFIKDLTKNCVRFRFLIIGLSTLIYIFLSKFLINDIGIEYENLYLSNLIKSMIFTVVNCECYMLKPSINTDILRIA